MTKTTDTRQLGMIFRGVLEKYGAWESLVAEGRDLQVEMDLVMAARMFFAEVKQIGAVNVRQKVFETLKLAEAKVADSDAMESRIKSALGIAAVNKEWIESVIPFLIREDKEGRTIESFARACEEDKFNMPKSHQIAMNPKLIIAMWPKVYNSNSKTENVNPDTDGGYH